MTDGIGNGQALLKYSYGHGLQRKKQKRERCRKSYLHFVVRWDKGDGCVVYRLAEIRGRG